MRCVFGIDDGYMVLDALNRKYGLFEKLDKLWYEPYMYTDEEGNWKAAVFSGPTVGC